MVDIVYPPSSALHNILFMTLQMSFQSSYFHQLTRGSFPKISNRVGMFFREWQMMKIITIRIEIRASFRSRFLKTESKLLLGVWKRFKDENIQLKIKKATHTSQQSSSNEENLLREVTHVF